MRPRELIAAVEHCIGIAAEKDATAAD